MIAHNRSNSILRATCLGGWLLVCASGVAAEVQPEPQSPAPAKSESFFTKWFEQDYMLGNWGGLRSFLSTNGVDFEFLYLASNPHNISGGIKTGDEYQGGMLMTLDLDSEKLVGYEGGHLHASGAWINGADVFSDAYIGDLNKVNLVDFPNSWRLWELWYEQAFFGGKVSLKAGQLSVDQDFIKAEYYGGLGNITLLNQTFFYPTLAFNVWYPPNHHELNSTPYSAVGARLKVETSERTYAQAAVYNGGVNRDHSTHVVWDENQGALVYGEIGYKRNQLPGDTGLPGNLKLGGFYHSGDFPNYPSYAAFFGGAAVPTFEPNTYGGYFLADLMLVREQTIDDPAKQGLYGFFRTEGAPPDRSLTQFGVDGGLMYRGLIPTRNWDTIALAASYLQMSRDLRKGQEQANAAAPGTFPALANYEGVIELSYKAQLTAWMTMQVSIQRVFNPGGNLNPAFALPGGTEPRDAWAFILFATLRL